ncbi:acyl carrier protein [Kitasatospora sp. RG8]|uniref:acyl carrier protein n=1 Tax=Kitasatospora sp. RG8 TaxID=2820815 RepID=UPI001AE0A508|nr:acyl carrier protein [Kitasatospora sp. RG8]MBP0455148.1 acyl carrier protein [Kitasatospora sp. RG8]
MNRTILDVVDGMFRHQLQVAELDPDVPLVNYGLDSVRSITLVVDMESEFGVQISDEQAAAMHTLRDVAHQVGASLAARTAHDGQPS